MLYAEPSSRVHDKPRAQLTRAAEDDDVETLGACDSLTSLESLVRISKESGRSEGSGGPSEPGILRFNSYAHSYRKRTELLSVAQRSLILLQQQQL